MTKGKEEKLAKRRALDIVISAVQVFTAIIAAALAWLLGPFGPWGATNLIRWLQTVLIFFLFFIVILVLWTVMNDEGLLGDWRKWVEDYIATRILRRNSSAIESE